MCRSPCEAAPPRSAHREESGTGRGRSRPRIGTTREPSACPRKPRRKEYRRGPRSSRRRSPDEARRSARCCRSEGRNPDPPAPNRSACSTGCRRGRALPLEGSRSRRGRSCHLRSLGEGLRNCPGRLHFRPRPRTRAGLGAKRPSGRPYTCKALILPGKNSFMSTRFSSVVSEIPVSVPRVPRSNSTVAAGIVPEPDNSSPWLRMLAGFNRVREACLFLPGNDRILNRL